MAENVTWMHYGFSHVLIHGAPGVSGCWCNVTRFDVDRFGRIFYPNTFQGEFNVIDNNRNHILRQKNRDIPEVAIGVPQAIEVTDRAMYVADWYNNQIAVFRLEAEADSLLPLYWTGLAGTVSDRLDNIGFVNRPNPFNPATAFHFEAGAKSVLAKLSILDLSGKLVRPLLSRRLSGKQTVHWNGKDLSGHAVASGVYVAYVKSAGGSKMVKIAVER